MKLIISSVGLIIIYQKTLSKMLFQHPDSLHENLYVFLFY